MKSFISESVAGFISALFAKMTNFAWFVGQDQRILWISACTINGNTSTGMKETKRIAVTHGRNTGNEFWGKDLPSQ